MISSSRPTSDVPERSALRPIMTNGEWSEILGDIIEVFRLVEGGFASASETAGYLLRRNLAGTRHRLVV